MKVNRANNIKIVKKANTYLVLSTIRKFEYITVENIISNTGLSRPTVLNIIKELTDKQIVKKAGFAESEVGRSPVLYSLNTEGFFAIGVDIDGPPVHIAVSDINGKLVYSDKFELSEDANVETIRTLISNSINKLIIKNDIHRDNILGIGLGLPASIDIVNNCALNVSRLQVLANQPIADMISKDTGIDVVVRNDAHLIGVAEKRRLDQNANDLLCIVYRTGIGMATILNNELYSGRTGNSGYIGHTTIDFNGKKCACGRRGCLEGLTSKRAIRESYREATGSSLGYRAILALADNGDKIAIDICKDAGNYLGIGIANMVKIFDIYNVVIADICCSEKHVLFKSISKSVKENISPYLKKPCKLYPGSLNDEELALGGCNFVIDEFFVSPELVLKA